MRIAVVSDIHGNRTAFDAVLADLRHTSPDLIFHGGDLADGGSSPAEIVDRIRDLGWPGVIGNVDEMLARPESLEEFASQSTQIQPLLPAIRESAAWSREPLGPERIAWLGALPLQQTHAGFALVHASPASSWRSPGISAADSELESVYAPLGKSLAVYGHIHQGFIRKLPAVTVVNTGSVSLAYDGDPRASYLLIDNGEPQLRRVEYDIAAEVKVLHQSGHPRADWIGRMLGAAGFRMP